MVVTQSVIPDAYTWPEQQSAIHAGVEDFDEALKIPVVDLGDGNLLYEEIYQQSGTLVRGGDSFTWERRTRAGDAGTWRILKPFVARRPRLSA